MIRNEKNGIVYYTFDNLSKAGGIRHLFSTRLGGVSQGAFANMNLSFSRGDDERNVMENFKRISGLGFPIEKMVFSDQIHETIIKRVSGNDCGKGILTASDLTGVDGLMTDEPGVMLVTFYADCVPLYFFDPVKKAVALAHAGWRGTLLGIGKITLDEMKREFGSDPHDILVGIGPSICQSCFEVKNEIVELFAARHYGEFITNSPVDQDKSFIDLQGINKQTLIGAGLQERNIELPYLCTKCNPEMFYSHRAMRGERGSMAAFLSINS